MPQLRAATASLKRIEKYLSLEERTDLPVPLDAADDASEYSGEKKDDAPPAATDVAFEAASFSWAADKPAFLGPLSVGLIPGYLHLCVGPVASVRQRSFIYCTVPSLIHLSLLFIGQDLVPSVRSRRVGSHDGYLRGPWKAHRVRRPRPADHFRDDPGEHRVRARVFRGVV